MHSLIRAMAVSTPEMLRIFGDEALLEAALRFESELAKAQATEGLISASAAAIIEECCREPIDVSFIANKAAFSGTLAIPLVQLLRERVAIADPEAAKAVHLGATSQDLVDTAMMSTAKVATGAIARDGSQLCEALATLTRAHLATPTIGRTLLQNALPITFGLKTANWLTGVKDALERLRREATVACALQFGGPSGALSGLNGKGLAVGARIAGGLGLAATPLPWQSRRGDVAGLASALSILGGTVGKIARDVSLLAQSEIAEVLEPHQRGRGGSSSMVHKRNSTGCQVALCAAARMPGLAATILSTLPQEHERALAGWQTEASVLADLFCLAHGAIAAMLPVIEGLEVHPDRMATNLAKTNVGTDQGISIELAQMALAAYDRVR